MSWGNALTNVLGHPDAQLFFDIAIFETVRGGRGWMRYRAFCKCEERVWGLAADDH